MHLKPMQNEAKAQINQQQAASSWLIEAKDPTKTIYSKVTRPFTIMVDQINVLNY